MDWDLGDVDAAAVVSPLLLVKLEDLQVLCEEFVDGQVYVCLARVELCPLVADQRKFVRHEVLVDVLNCSIC